MRADLRRFADQRHVDMGDAAAAGADPAGRVVEEDRRRRALPLRIARRKMPADVALAERAIDRVGDRMQRDVGVGMAGELLLVGDEHAREPNAAALGERVDVEALADSRFCRPRAEPRFGLGQVLHRRHLEIVGVAVEHVDGDAHPLGDGGVVGEIGAFGAPVRGENEVELEGLRRLHGAQRRAVGSADDPTLGVDLLDRVGDRGPRHGGAVGYRRLDRAGDERGRGKRPRAVVDQRDVDGEIALRLEAEPHALLPRLAAESRRRQHCARPRRQPSNDVLV